MVNDGTPDEFKHPGDVDDADDKGGNRDGDCLFSEVQSGGNSRYRDHESF